jgi:acetolactate synthase-1/3 small subunit
MTAFLFMKRKMEDHMTFSILTEDRFGVLMQITSFFSARGYTIEKLNAERFMTAGHTRVSVVLNCPESVGDRIVKQLHKLTEVIEAEVEAEVQVTN